MVGIYLSDFVLFRCALGPWMNSHLGTIYPWLYRNCGCVSLPFSKVRLLHSKMSYNISSFAVRATMYENVTNVSSFTASVSTKILTSDENYVRSVLTWPRSIPARRIAAVAAPQGTAWHTRKVQTPRCTFQTTDWCDVNCSPFLAIRRPLQAGFTVDIAHVTPFCPSTWRRWFPWRGTSYTHSGTSYTAHRTTSPVDSLHRRSFVQKRDETSPPTSQEWSRSCLQQFSCLMTH